MHEAPQHPTEGTEALTKQGIGPCLTKAEAAKYLAVSERTLGTYKEIPRFQYRRRGKVTYSRPKLDQWLEQHQVRNDQQDLDCIVDEALKAVLGS